MTELELLASAWRFVALVATERLGPDQPAHLGHHDGLHESEKLRIVRAEARRQPGQPSVRHLEVAGHAVLVVTRRASDLHVAGLPAALAGFEARVAGYAVHGVEALGVE